MKQRKLILSNIFDANYLAAKIAKHRPGRHFTYLPIDHGYQVVEIRKFAGFGYTWDGQKWSKVDRKHAESPMTTQTTPREVVTATVTLEMVADTKAYIGAKLNGAVAWFGKSTLVSFSVDAGQVTMTLPAKVAAKRGIAA